jgi:hypothetical protein
MTTKEEPRLPGRKAGHVEKRNNYQTLSGAASTVFGTAVMAYGLAHLSGGDSLNLCLLCAGANLLADMTAKEAAHA